LLESENLPVVTPGRFRRKDVFLVFLAFLLIKVLTWGMGYYLAVSGRESFNVVNYLENFHHSRLDKRILMRKR
jgi:hypothetical protein